MAVWRSGFNEKQEKNWREFFLLRNDVTKDKIVWRHSQTTPITNGNNTKPFFSFKLFALFFANSMKKFSCLSVSVFVFVLFTIEDNSSLKFVRLQCPFTFNNVLFVFLSFDNVAIVAKSFDNVAFVVQSFSLSRHLLLLSCLHALLRTVSQS